MIPEIIKILKSNNSSLVQAVGGIQLISEDWLLNSKRNITYNSNTYNSKTFNQNMNINLAKRCMYENN